MELVVDANTLFAALIRIKVTSDLIVDNSLTLYSVDFLEKQKAYFANAVFSTSVDNNPQISGNMYRDKV